MFEGDVGRGSSSREKVFNVRERVFNVRERVFNVDREGLHVGEGLH
jgi:hypothetical protein